MTYDWRKELSHPEGSVEFFQAIDRRFWEAAWFAHNPGDPPFSKLIPFDELKGKRVLEIGCGAGALTAQFARHGAEITAVDLTKRAVGLARRRFEVIGLHGDIRNMDARQLEFDDESFDFVWSWGVIHHSENTEKIVAEIHRVLKPGGKTRLMVYNRNSIDFQVGIRFIRGVLMGGLLRLSLDELANECSDGFIAKFYTPDQFKEMFKTQFRDVEAVSYGQKAELWQIPHGRLKDFLIKKTPNKLAGWITQRFGSFLFLSARK